MKPKSRLEVSPLDLFQAQFEPLLNHDHPLFLLAKEIDWNRFDVALADCDCPDTGAPAKAIRLLVGLHFLKHTFNESDESLLERWVENPYWQNFCGFTTLQHELPLHPTSLTKWRQCVGAEKLAEMLAETIALVLRRRVPNPDEALEELLRLCERLHAQKQTDSKKLYSLHEPDVMCISKGKAHKRYEFGQKVSVATTNRGNGIVGVALCAGNPYDGHTLAQAIASVEKITDVNVTDAYVAKGYRGHDDSGAATVHRAGSSVRNLTRTKKKRRKRRSAVEPKIGHLKSDNRMKRCFLKGLVGDAINAVLAAAGSNLQKLLRAFACALIFWLKCVLPETKQQKNMRPMLVPAV